jgi:hypothetical protein
MKQNLSLNELINSNYSNVYDNAIQGKKEKFNKEETGVEEINFNVSSVIKDLPDIEIKELGSIDLVGITKEYDNDVMDGRRNCTHRFTSKLSYSILFFSNF